MIVSIQVLLLLLILINITTLSITNRTTSDDISKWRNDYHPELIDFHNDKGIQNEYSKQYVYIHQYDKDNHPVIYYNVSNYDKNNRNLNDVKRLTIYILDKALRLSNDDKFIVIVDLKNFSITKTMDIDMINMVLHMIQSSTMLHKAIAINSPYIFQTVWNMIKVLLNYDTRSKVAFFSIKDLPQLVDNDNLPIGFRSPLTQSCS